MGYITEQTIPTREKRTGALSHFHGTAAELLAAVFPQEGEIAQRIRTLSTAGRDEILSAQAALATVKDAAVVVHGAAGCALGALESAGAVFSTNLTERDTILGSDETLRRAILAANAGRPEVIFILGTPVTAINNDDVASVLLELEGEVPAKLVFVKTDGFQTKTAVSGCDLAAHALLRHVVEGGGGEEPPFLNLIAMSENPADIGAVTALLGDTPFNLLPRFSSAAAIRRAGGAAATLTLNPDEGEVLAEGLEEGFGVPRPELPAPVGFDAIQAWNRALEALGHRADPARWEAVAGLRDQRPLEGRRVFLHLEAAVLQPAFSLVRALGGTVCGVMVPYVDEVNRHRLAFLSDYGDTTAIVGPGQGVELANALSKLKPDAYLGEVGAAALAASYGARPLLASPGRTIYGYDGICNIAAEAGGTIPDLFRLAPVRYRPSWLRKSGSWHVKREVK